MHFFFLSLVFFGTKHNLNIRAQPIQAHTIWAGWVRLLVADPDPKLRKEGPTRSIMQNPNFCLLFKTHAEDVEVVAPGEPGESRSRRHSSQ